MSGLSCESPPAPALDAAAPVSDPFNISLTSSSLALDPKRFLTGFGDSDLAWLLPRLFALLIPLARSEEELEWLLAVGELPLSKPDLLSSC